MRYAELLDWEKGFTVYFDLITGLSRELQSSKRTISDMLGMYADADATEKLIKEGDPLVYEYYDIGAPNASQDLAFGTSIVYPGKVGNEYFMTKGHFHNILDTAEVYYCLQGHGYILMENHEGDWNAQELAPGQAVYVPPCYAHRSINVGNTPLITFFCFRGDAGHDYDTIETMGYRKIIIDRDDEIAIIDNPKWKRTL